MRILIADDEAVSRRLLEATLVRLGHEVIVARDGMEARRALLAEGAPRLAILDWMMPGADGLDVCRAVRRNAARYTYVILLTMRSGHQDMVTALGAEADDFLTKPFDSVELQARIRSGERILDLEKQLVDAQDALRHEAMVDRLTSAWNRGTILDRLRQECLRADRQRHHLAIVLADLDHFKSINDTYGHVVGDRVLVEVSRRMRSALRGMDVLGRYGGEEFLSVLPGCTSDQALTVSERVRRTVAADPIVAGATSLFVTLSAGIGALAPGDDPERLIQAADEALYVAKARGRNRSETSKPRPEGATA